MPSWDAEQDPCGVAWRDTYVHPEPCEPAPKTHQCQAQLCSMYSVVGISVARGMSIYWSL